MCEPQLAQVKVLELEHRKYCSQPNGQVYLWLKAKTFTLGEWYSCRGLAVVVNSGVSTLGF